MQLINGSEAEALMKRLQGQIPTDGPYVGSVIFLFTRESTFLRAQSLNPQVTKQAMMEAIRGSLNTADLRSAVQSGLVHPFRR